MRTPLIVLASAGAVLLGAAVLAQQEVSPTPRAGTGIVTVTGTVDIGAMPEVSARQNGEWLVSINRMPEVTVSATEFVRTGGRYLVTWTDGSSERVVVAATGSGGWVRVEHPAGAGRQLWVNFTAARAVEEIQ